MIAVCKSGGALSIAAQRARRQNDVLELLRPLDEDCIRRGTSGLIFSPVNGGVRGEKYREGTCEREPKEEWDEYVA